MTSEPIRRWAVGLSMFLFSMVKGEWVEKRISEHGCATTRLM